ncbi:MAG: transcriptional regulator/antitoxin, MazE [Candidatus Peribacteria bacterium]|nr:transcriptional regulator/antitoxin, MazE [Candidatus Peribacteria bacterium]
MSYILISESWFATDEKESSNDSFHWGFLHAFSYGLDINVSTMYTRSMKTVIRSWGNSLAVRIPKAFAMHLGIEPGKEVDLSMEPDGLKIATSVQNLESLLKQVTSQNIHSETLTGDSTGREVW